MPTYNANIPQPTDQLSQSQDDLLNNFQAISALINVNHVDFNTADQGKHKFVEFPVQSPVPTTSAGEVGLYSQVSTFTSQPELVFAKQSGSTAPASARVNEFTSAGYSAIGWNRLPCGILLKWGLFSFITGGVETFTYPTGGGLIPPFAATPYQVFLTLIANVNNPSSITIFWDTFHGGNSATTLGVYSIGSAIVGNSFGYLAIGV